jgi:hypothetical protein
MLNWLRRKFAPQPETKEGIDHLPPTVAGSQKSLETEQHRYLLPQFGLIHPFDLNDYLQLYLTDPLAKAIVDADVNLTVSELLYESESDAVNEYLIEFNRKVGIDELLWTLCRDQSLFGFAGHEIVGNAAALQASTEIIGIRRIDPRYLFVQKNRLGRVEKYWQKPLTASYAIELQMPFGVALSPESILYVSTLSPLTTYGHSILQSLKARLEDRNRLITATVLAHEKFANAVDWVQYVADKEKDEVRDEIQEQVAALDEATSEVMENNVRFMVSGGTGTYHYTRIGAEELPDATDLLDKLTTDIILSAGFHPSVFGSADANTEASRYTVNSIITRQRNLMAQLHQKLYSLLPFIDADCPVDDPNELVVNMQPPDETTMKEQLEAEAIRLNNVGLKMKMGAITEKKAAQELGYSEWADKELGDKWKNGNVGEVNDNDPNEVQQNRKAIDTMNDGKRPSNNPSGGKE